MLVRQCKRFQLVDSVNQSWFACALKGSVPQCSQCFHNLACYFSKEEYKLMISGYGWSTRQASRLSSQ